MGSMRCTSDEILTKCPRLLPISALADASSSIWWRPALETGRKKTSEKYSDKQFVSIKHHETGVLTRTREETNEVLLSYNLILLQKDKVIKTEEILQDDVIQDIIIKCGMEEEELEKDKEFTWEEFTEVMTKVKLSNKSVYRDLVKAGKIFHLLYLRFLNRIYTREQLPKAFNKTTLMKLECVGLL